MSFVKKEIQIDTKLLERINEIAEKKNTTLNNVINNYLEEGLEYEYEKYSKEDCAAFHEGMDRIIEDMESGNEVILNVKEFFKQWRLWDSYTI